MFYTLANRPAAADVTAANRTAANPAVNRMLSPFAFDAQPAAGADRRTDRSFEKAISEALGPFFSAGPAFRAPTAATAQFKDLDTGYELQLDVPGIAREHLDIGIEGDVVRLASKEGAARNVKAAWRFPLEIDAAASKAKLEHGVLSLHLVKKLPVSNIVQLTVD